MIDTDKYEKYKSTQSNYQTSDRYIKDLLAEIKRLREQNNLLLQGINDACSTASSGAKRPVADGSIKHYFPLYLREMIE
tara:strand:+ start:281 stop:517 length:237 start_codon:yes stop_codon:yes gene_type:complete